MELEPTSRGQRELVIHTGQDRSLIDSLVQRWERHRPQLHRQGIGLGCAEALEPAILRNDWSQWHQLQRRPRWAPWWPTSGSVWVGSHAMLRPLLQERRIQRLRPQFEAHGLRPVIVVHLLDASEQLVRDFARAVLNLRWCGSFEAFVQNRLERDPLRYHVDAQFLPLLEWCGALGVRFVLHTGRSRRQEDPGLTPLLTLMAGGSPLGPLASIPRRSAQAQASLQRLQLSRLVLQTTPRPPKGALRHELLALIRRTLDEPSMSDSQGLADHLWTPLLSEPVKLPLSVRRAQRTLALKVWGGSWPRQKTAVEARQEADGRYGDVVREAERLLTRRAVTG